jgi:hypothetical protein
MTALTLPRAVPAVTRSARALGAVEAKRMIRHPAYLIATIYPLAFLVAAITAGEGGPAANVLYVFLFLCLFLIYAPVTMIVANRVAAGTYRRKVRAAFDATPLDGRQRTLAAILGLLRGPVLVGLAGAAALLVIGEFATATTAIPNDAVFQRTFWEYLQLPALVLGAGLLGIAIARWLPWPGVLPVAVLVVWLGTIAMYQYAGPDNVVPTRTWFALWPVWVAGQDGMLPLQPLGREVAHLAYLLGLGILAGIAALLRTDGRRHALWIAAGAAGVMTALCAWLQLG